MFVVVGPQLSFRADPGVVSIDTSAIRATGNGFNSARGSSGCSVWRGGRRRGRSTGRCLGPSATAAPSPLSTTRLLLTSWSALRRRQRAGAGSVYFSGPPYQGRSRRRLFGDAKSMFGPEDLRLIVAVTGRTLITFMVIDV